MHEMLTSYLNHPFHFTFPNTPSTILILYITFGAELSNCHMISNVICVQTHESSQSSLHGHSVVLKKKLWSV